MNIRTIRLAATVPAFLLILSALAGCYTPPESVPEGLTQMEFFQRAQEAADQSRWETATLYYEEFLRRFPDDRPAQMEARYELAFIAYKQEDYQRSLDLFDAVLATYEADQSGALPEWPRVLSLRLVAIIEERLEK